MIQHTLFSKKRLTIFLLLLSLIVPNIPIPAQAATRSWVAEENAKQGSLDWVIPSDKLASGDEITGYTKNLKPVPGDTVTLRATSHVASSFNITAYRVGYYGGDEARAVWSKSNVPVTHQPNAHFFKTDKSGHIINEVNASNWSDTLLFSTSGWPEGNYLLKLTIPNGKQAYVPLVLHSTSYSGRTMVVNATNTWQAYNDFGGFSAYRGNRDIAASDATRISTATPSGSTDAASRSRKLSFSRPYSNASYNGPWSYMKFERPLVVEAERSGVNLGYTSSLYFDEQGVNMRSANALIMLGHDEYWTNAMVRAVQTLRDSGTNYAAIGANSMWWRVRYDDTPRGSVMTIYKSSTEDPIKSSAERTTNFSAGGEYGIVPTLGSRYLTSGVDAPLTVTNPNFFLFNGTGATMNQSYPKLLAGEVDNAQILTDTPVNLHIAARSPLVRNTASGAQPVWSDMTYYTASSGAGVFNAATFGFSYAVDNHPLSGTPDMPTSTRDFARKVVSNVFTMMSGIPLASRYPTVSNYDTLMHSLPNKYVAPVEVQSTPRGRSTTLSGAYTLTAVELIVNGKSVVPTTTQNGVWSVSIPIDYGTYSVKARSTAKVGGTLFGPWQNSNFVVPPPRPSLYKQTEETKATVYGTYAPGTVVKAIVGNTPIPVKLTPSTRRWESVFGTATGEHTVKIWSEASDGTKSSINAIRFTTSVRRPTLYVSTKVIASNRTQITVHGTGRAGNDVLLKCNGVTQRVTVNSNGSYYSTMQMGRHASAVITVQGVYSNDLSPINSATVTTP